MLTTGPYTPEQPVLPVTNVIYRTFFIKGEQYGSAFTIDHEGEEYLVTAKHLLDTATTTPTILIYRHKAWHALETKLVGHGAGEVDVSVLKVPIRLTHDSMIVAAHIGGLSLGQDMIFLGFPYKMSGDVGDFLGGYSMPFVKKGTLSIIEHGNPTVLQVDAINNEGFSGGPLCFTPLANPLAPHIAGVVSKYRVEPLPVLNAQGEPTGNYVQYNTGFLIAYGINHAIDLIKRNPNP